MTIIINVIGQQMAVKGHKVPLAPHSENFIKLTFSLPQEWKNFKTFAQFRQSNNSPINVYLDESNSVYVPREIKAGNFTVMLYGAGESIIGTTNCLIFDMVDNCFSTDAIETDLTPTLYQQLLNEFKGYLASTKADAESATASENAAKDYATAANTSAQSAATSADNATAAEKLAKDSATKANTSAELASNYANKSEESAKAALVSQQTASESQKAAGDFAKAASDSELAAGKSATTAAGHADTAKTYAIQAQTALASAEEARKSASASAVAANASATEAKKSEDAVKANAEQVAADKTAAASSQSAAAASAKSASDSASDASGSASAAAGSAKDAAASAAEVKANADQVAQDKSAVQEYAQNAYNSAVGAESAKDDAEDARDEIRSMGAEAVTLSPGSNATASYSDGLLSLGIPRGDKGETGATGATGPKGDKGDTGEVSAEQLNTALATKADAIISSASGAIASFQDGATRPVDDLTVQIEPVQDLHGYDNPWPAGGGKNLADTRNRDVAIAGVRFVSDADGVISISGTRDSSTGWKPIASFTNFAPGNYVFSTNSTHLTCLVNWTQNSSAFTVTEGDVVRIALYNISAGDVINESGIKVQIESGSTATAWSPYANICPITGFDSVKVTRTGKNLLNPKLYSGGAYNPTIGSTWNLVESSNQLTNIGNGQFSVTLGSWAFRVFVFDLADGQSYRFRCNFAGTDVATCYGYLDEDYAVLTKYNETGATVNKSVTFTGTSEMKRAYVGFAPRSSKQTLTLTEPQLELGSTATAYEPYQGETYDIAFPSEAGTVYGGTLDVTNGVLTVDRVQIASYAGETLPSTWISDRDVYSARATPTTGAQVVYELATPITYHLTPQEITTLLGQNNIWADTGDTSVTYRADTKLYIDKKFTELQALILEN